MGTVGVVGIHHVSLNIADTERSLKFYESLLGLNVLPRPDFGFGGAWLDAGGGRQIHLIEAAAPPDLGQHVALEVADIDSAVAVLRAAGVETPDPAQIGETAGRQTFVNDPDGNRVELTQPALA